MRGVCFDPSPNTLVHFAKVAKSKCPVKLNNFQTSIKRKGHGVDIIIRKKTKLEDLKEVPFDHLDVIPTTTSTIVGSLKDLKSWSAVNAYSNGKQFGLN